MPLNFVRTAFLLLAMTLLFVAVGYAVGGAFGMVIAFAIALGMNLFSLYKSDTMVLRMHKAQLLDERTGGQLYQIARELAQRAELPMPKGYSNAAAERICDRAKPTELNRCGVHRPARTADGGGGGGRGGA
jgi:Zn-dependent protease with chaperone function